jgi:hypothetical protein
MLNKTTRQGDIVLMRCLTPEAYLPKAGGDARVRSLDLIRIAVCDVDGFGTFRARDCPRRHGGATAMGALWQ